MLGYNLNRCIVSSLSRMYWVLMVDGLLSSGNAAVTSKVGIGGKIPR